MWGISRLAEELLASQEGFCSMDEEEDRDEEDREEEKKTI